MDDIKEAFVYNKGTKLFNNNQYTALQLKEIEDSNDTSLGQFRSNLYSRKEVNDRYRIVFVNTEKPYFRKYGKGEAKKYGLSSYNESPIHNAVKCGIAAAQKLRIIIDGKQYIIKKKSSEIEEFKQLMGWVFETDCMYEIENIDPELERKLNGSIIYFEVHHKSKVSERKIMAYTINGFNIYEFDVLDQKYYKLDKNNIKDKIERTRLVKEFYEKTDSHFINGRLYPPIDFELEWDGGYAWVTDPKTGKDIKATVYIDRITHDKYDINFKMDGKDCNRYDLFDLPIEDFNTAKQYAKYMLYMHLTGKETIDFN